MFSRQLTHLTRIVDDLLDVGRITSGKIALESEIVELNQLLQERAATIQPLLEQHSQSLQVSLPVGATPIRGDATRIGQVVSNLLSNAQKYTPDGGRIWVVLERDDNHARFEVTDNGIGMAPELWPLMFEPFVQGERGLDRREGGLGLGLTLVKRLVELHGGSVAATSDGPGRGSTLSVRLPLAPASGDADKRVPSENTAVTVRLKALVVDDNEDIVESMRRLLEIMGHEVATAGDGEEALRAAERFKPDIVLLDIGLPRKNGFQVATELRAIPELRSTTIVACSGYGRAEDKQRAIETGFDRHVIKPVAMETLAAILSDAAAKKARSPQPGSAAN